MTKIPYIDYHYPYNSTKRYYACGCVETTSSYSDNSDFQNERTCDYHAYEGSITKNDKIRKLLKKLLKEKIKVFKKNQSCEDDSSS